MHYTGFEDERRKEYKKIDTKLSRGYGRENSFYSMEQEEADRREKEERRELRERESLESSPVPKPDVSATQISAPPLTGKVVASDEAVVEASTKTPVEKAVVKGREV